MVINKRKFNYALLVDAALIVVIAAVTYLPGLSRASVYRDDWYYMMDRLIGGPGSFEQMFSIDRPARGPLFETYFEMFGVTPLPYHLSSLAWRALGGLAAWWLFRLLWPNRRAAFVMGLLFVLYPGYLRWMEGFENQPRILSSFLEVLSIALTLKALRTSSKISQVVAWVASILSGWAYIALVDFSIGMEVFRLLCVFAVVSSQQPGRSLLEKGLASLRKWSVAAVIPLGFLAWRLFIFHNERPATDVGLQLGALLGSPFSTGMWWLARLIQSSFNVLVLAWAAPVYQDLFGTRLANILEALLVATVSVVVFLCANWLMGRGADAADGDDTGWAAQAVWMGLAGVVVGVAPVVLANRYVTFGNYSHYALPASLASALAVTGLIFSRRSRRMQVGGVALLVALAALTHFTISMQIVREEQVIAGFWQQVVWRAPGIKAGTTLAVNYAGVNFAEDVDAAAGPANFLYFPAQTRQIPAFYPLLALPQMDYTAKDVISGGERPYGYRTHVGVINYANLLVMSQPADGSCVHVFDARWPRFSDQDSDQMLLMGSYSKIENVITSGHAPLPAQAIFGPEPEHGWCYYYQKAELALQQQDLDGVVKLGSEVDRLDLHPVDRVEWGPFLQAYAALGMEQAFKITAVKIDSSQFVRLQACRSLTRMQADGVVFDQPIRMLMDEKLCRGRKNDPAETAP